MKKKRIIMATGFAILGIAAIFTVNAGGKFAKVINIYFSTLNGGCISMSQNPVAKFSTIGMNQAVIRTSLGGHSMKLWQNACNPILGKRVYFKG